MMIKYVVEKWERKNDSCAVKKRHTGINEGGEEYADAGCLFATWGYGEGSEE